MKPAKSWPRRHPLIFSGVCIIVFLLVFAWGRMSVEEGPLVGPKIAVINLEGIILDAAHTILWIDKIRLEPAFKGAVLRINSPGGAVGPSQEIYAALKRLDAVKPVVASMGALAASGGYYASLGAREIYASPSSLTASIGVKMQVPNFEELMKTIGISETTLTTGKLKDAGSSWRSMTPDEELYLSSLLEDMYEEFINTVALERKLPIETVRRLADGRAMTGRQALEAKLVDRLGDRHETVQRVMQLCNLTEPSLVKIVEGPEKPGSLLKELMSSLVNIAMEHRSKTEQPLFMY
jgi:protease-4